MSTTMNADALRTLPRLCARRKSAAGQQAGQWAAAPAAGPERAVCPGLFWQKCVMRASMRIWDELRGSGPWIKAREMKKQIEQ